MIIILGEEIPFREQSLLLYSYSFAQLCITPFSAIQFIKQHISPSKNSLIFTEYINRQKNINLQMIFFLPDV